MKERSPEAITSLSELAWETKKHFFSEESAIFDFVTMENYGVLATINQLKDEHFVMLGDLKRFSENLPNIASEDLENFHNSIESHRKIEEEKLYPKLDKELSNEQKKLIVSRINEIPLTE